MADTGAELWSVTSYKALREEALSVERWNRLHPGEPPRTPLVSDVLVMLIGVVLLVFPWSEYWDNNFFSNLIPMFRNLWDNSYVRGAVSGLGIVNIVIAFSELFRLRRFSKS